MTQRSGPQQWLVVAVAVAGLLTAGNILVARAMGAEPLLCAAQSDCGFVHTTKYATFLGVPTAAWGVVLYGVVAGLGVVGLRGRLWLTACVLSVVGLSASTYLTYVAAFVVGTNCTYCDVSSAIALVLFVIVFGARPTRLTLS